MATSTSTTDHTVEGIGPQVGSTLLAESWIVVVRKMDANVTLQLLASSAYENRLGFAYNKPVPKIRHKPAFSGLDVFMANTCCTGKASSHRSVKIWITEYDIHHGASLKHLPPWISLSQKKGMGRHWNTVPMTKTTPDRTMNALKAWHVRRNLSEDIAKMR